MYLKFDQAMFLFVNRHTALLSIMIPKKPGETTAFPGNETIPYYIIP